LAAWRADTGDHSAVVVLWPLAGVIGAFNANQAPLARGFFAGAIFAIRHAARAFLRDFRYDADKRIIGRKTRAK
jgi:hypothetical protein